MRRKTKEQEKGVPYRCSQCKKTMLRDSTKKWIKSYCESVGTWSRLMRVD